MANGKLREARTSAERLAAILVMVINRNDSNNALAREQGKQEHHILAAGDFLPIVQPFLDLAEIQAQKTEVTAGKVIGVALREKSLHELGARETAALFAIAELIRKLELPPQAEQP
jgi:hypothetical protein